MQQHSRSKGFWSQQKLQQLLGIVAVIAALAAIGWAVRWDTIDCGEGWCMQSNRWTGEMRLLDAWSIGLGEDTTTAFDPDTSSFLESFDSIAGAER